MRGLSPVRIGSKTCKIGNFMIRSRAPISHYDMLVLNRRGVEAIILVRDRMFDGIWTITELR